MAKSAAERAQENVDLGTAKVARLQKQLDGIKPKFDKVTAELAEAKTDLEYAKTHPALAGGAAQPALTEAEIEENFPKTEDPASAEPEKELVRAIEPDEVKAVEPEQAKGGLFDQDDPFAN